MDAKGGLINNEEAGLPYNYEDERSGRGPHSFIEIQDGKEKSKGTGTKSHSRTLSSPYERKERYKKSVSKSNVSEDFISPRMYSSQGRLIGFQGRKRFGRRRGLYETTSLRKTMDNVNLKSADGSVERLYMTEAINTNPSNEELLDQQRKKRKYDDEEVGVSRQARSKESSQGPGPRNVSRGTDANALMRRSDFSPALQRISSANHCRCCFICIDRFLIIAQANDLASGRWS